jgi:hypothetical protein
MSQACYWELWLTQLMECFKFVVDRACAANVIYRIFIFNQDIFYLQAAMFLFVGFMSAILT